ncbi:MurR/RpiR family transcriptional regulator [Neobacillus niacini]|uniref:MurR/RpiR family transcriptional regulator n=1 Tax=Neobacillus niacini TaxID=86668 RepID=UPI0005F082CC|nr:MurR/RpiR family transcriptional regulator [Neobacillus niacini]
MSTFGPSSPIGIIKSTYNSLTKSEQKVADIILEGAKESVYSSVTDLAEKAGVGETTIIRFCRKLKYRGFQEFKLAVAQSLSNVDIQIHGEIAESDHLDVIAKKITSQNASALQDTIDLLEAPTLEKAVEAILKARKLYFFGVGSSGYTAGDAKYRFMRLGYNVDKATDAHIIAMNAALAGKEDVVVAISSSGSTKDIVDGVRIAKENKALVICITNHARSPITNYADVILLSASKETPLQGGAFSSKIAQLHLLDILTTITGLRAKERSFKAIEKTAKAVLNKMY